MKLPYAISLMTTILFVALGAASLLLDFTVRTLRIAVAEQEGQARLFETRISEQVQAHQVLDEKREFQERENETLGRKIAQKKLLIERQQDQITQGTQIAQQVGPNLLHDLAGISLKNEKIKSLLTKHGYTVQTK